MINISKYVISDLHGQYNKFIKMLELIQFTDSDQMYILGDVIDRGQDSIKLLKYIMKQSNIELLLGNHEDMMINSLQRGSNDKYYWNMWFSNGGDITYEEFDKLSIILQSEIVEYLYQCKTHKIINKFFLSHAGLYIRNNTTTLKENHYQTDDSLIWSRSGFYLNKALEDYTVIFGHTPTYYIREERQESNFIPMKIWHDNKYKDKICIDCGVIAEELGQLGCLRLDDMKEFYVR